MMSTAPEIMHLLRLCDDAGPERETGRPHRLEHNGAIWSFSLDGYHAVAYKGVDLYDGFEADTVPFYPQPSPKLAQKVIDLMLSDEPAGITVDLLALRAWAEPPQWTLAGAKIRCDICEGGGDLTGFCPSCGRDEAERCKQCEGTGKVAAPLWPEKRRYGLIGGYGVDRERLARCLDGLPGETATILFPLEMANGRGIRIWTDAWQVLVMPYKVAPGEALPVFALLEAL
jgi:hypothetical protein